MEEDKLIEGAPATSAELRRFYAEYRSNSNNLYDLKRFCTTGRIVYCKAKKTWTDEEASEYIEKVIYGVPLDPMYFKSTVDNIWHSIIETDRLTILMSFFNDEFALKGLKVLSLLNGLKYSELKPFIGVQAKIEAKKLDLIVFNPCANDELIYLFYTRKKFN